MVLMRIQGKEIYMRGLVQSVEENIRGNQITVRTAVAGWKVRDDMTREEAQIIIGNIPIDGQDECYSIAEYQEAKTMAIKALEQELCDDCISRQAVWEVMQRMWGTSGELLDELMALPPVNPQEPKTGHWINTAEPYMSDNIVCSECGFDSIAGYSYCPNCGCRMVEPQESEG